MSLKIAACLVEVELRQRRVIRTRARNQQVVDRRTQLVEESPEAFEIESVEGRGAQRVELARGALERLGVSGSENDVCSLGARASGRFESDSGAAADDNNGLPEEFGAARDGRGGSCGAHDSSDQQSKNCVRLKT